MACFVWPVLAINSVIANCRIGWLTVPAKPTRPTQPDADGGYCYNLQSNVDYDVQSSLEYDLSTLTSDISTARQDITTVRADLANLNSSGLPLPAGAAASVAARQAIRQAVSAANADIDQVNQDVVTAYAAGNATATGSCAGDGPGSPPTPVSHIG